MSDTATLRGFAVIVGEDNCASDAGACGELAVDGLTPRCAVFPRSEEEVARVLHRAADHNLSVIASGGGTKLGTGNIPRSYDVALSLRQMRQVAHFEAADLTVSVEPGVELGDFQDFLRPHGLWIPLDPPGSRQASLGGIAAANASGPLRLKYGGPRDFILGMRIASTEGKVVKTGGRVVKNVAGYDLSRLLTGSYGTLGVITEVSLKLFPLPEGRMSWSVRVSNVEGARQFRRSILQSPLGPMRMVMLDRGAAALARASADSADSAGNDFEIWVEAGGSERAMNRFAETLRELGDLTRAKVEDLDAGIAEAGWNRIADFVSYLPESDSPLVALKATLPIASTESFVDLAAGEARKIGVRHACFCQNGVGVVRVCLMNVELSSHLTRSLAALRAEAADRGGSLIVEQCPPELKRSLDVWGHEGSDFALMRKLKELWDPKGTLSPGRFVGGL